MSIGLAAFFVVARVLGPAASADDYDQRARQAMRAESRPYAAPAQVYSLPSAVHFANDAQWRDYQRRHDEEQRREQRQNQAANEESARQAAQARRTMGAAPAPPFQGPDRRALAPSEHGGPGEVLEFKDTASELVRAFVKAKSSRGVYSIKDARTGETLALKLQDVHADVHVVSPKEALVCADFVTTRGPRRSVDLDFRLTKDWDWEVSKVLLHQINERPRFVYDRAWRPVAVDARAEAPAAPAPKPTAPANLTAEVSFRDASGDGRLAGGETGVFTVAVRNEGPGPAYRVTLKLDPRGGCGDLTLPEEVSFGDLAPGQSVAKDASLSASDAAKPGVAEVMVNVNEANGFDTEPVLVQFQTLAFAAPRLELAGVTAPEGGVKPGAAARVTLTVRNAGPGAASRASVRLALGSPDLFMSGEPEAALGELAPGERKSVEFEFFVNKRFKGPELPLTATLAESTGRFGAADVPLGLSVGAPGSSPQVLAVRAAEAGPENVDLPPASRTPSDPDAYAVVIGLERYRDVPGVDYAARDAQAMHDYLTSAMGFKPENAVLLVNDRATMTDLTTYLGPWLTDRARTSKSRVFVFYAGHGAPDPATGEGYLIPYDGSPSYAETKGYPLKRLYETLALLPASDVIVTLDSCFSGSGGRSLIAAGTRPLVPVKTRSPGVNTVVLAAAGADQISASYPEARHGLLTYFLLKGLRGAADGNRNGRVTTVELYDYLGPAVERQARLQHVEQQPTLDPSPASLGPRGARDWIVR